MTLHPLSCDQLLPLPFEQRPFSPADCLWFFDGPLLMWLPDAYRNLLAIALPDSAGDWPFLVVELDDDAKTSLQSNKLTLQDAVLHATHWYLLADYAADALRLRPLQQLPSAWLPGAVMLQNSPDSASASAPSR